jgi:hypothetical protein
MKRSRTATRRLAILGSEQKNPRTVNSFAEAKGGETEENRRRLLHSPSPVQNAFQNARRK